jgi:hypothetical protein
VLILELDADRFHFQQEGELPFELYGEIAVRASNHVLRGNLGILVVAEQVLQKIRHHENGVRLIDVPSLSRSEDGLKRLETVPNPIDDLCS